MVVGGGRGVWVSWFLVLAREVQLGLVARTEGVEEIAFARDSPSDSLNLFTCSSRW